MTTESEVKKARYGTVVKGADDLGRLIGVRRLKPSEQTKIAGMTPELTGADEAVGPNGEKIIVPHRMPLFIAATVCLIDDQPIMFPRTRPELDAIYDRLDVEGIAAASKAFYELQGGDAAVDINQVDEAKN